MTNKYDWLTCSLTSISYILCFIDMSSAAFIEPLPVLEFVAQLLGKDVLSRPLSDADRIKVPLSHSLCSRLVSLLLVFNLPRMLP